MIIAFAGLQATGKSTLAKELELALLNTRPVVLLDKDRVRDCLFAEHVDYSAAQNDLTLAIMYQLSAYYLSKNPETVIIIDGRTFSKTHQVEALKEAAKQQKSQLRIIECICSEESSRQRLKKDADTHLAKDRDFNLYQRVKAASQVITEPKLIINTDDLSPQESIQKILEYL